MSEIKEQTGGSLHLSGGGLSDQTLLFSSNSEMLDACQDLARRRIPFSVGRWDLGPADQMLDWQRDGTLPGPFLQIAWQGPEQWIIHEIVPGDTDEWEVVEPADLLGQEQRDEG